MIYTTSEDPCANALPLQSMNVQKLTEILLKSAQRYCCLPVLEGVHLEEKHLNTSMMVVMMHAKHIFVELSVMTAFHRSLMSFECKSSTCKHGDLEKADSGTCQNILFLTLAWSTLFWTLKQGDETEFCSVSPLCK